jgi:hypothetical protein
MKIILEEKNVEITEKKYPYIGIKEQFNGFNIIVIFSQENTGFGIATDEENNLKATLFSEKWEENNFSIYQGEIRISN